MTEINTRNVSRTHLWILLQPGGVAWANDPVVFRHVLLSDSGKVDLAAEVKQVCSLRSLQSNHVNMEAQMS